jgi:cell wall-associated NlpC family hydrolase
MSSCAIHRSALCGCLRTLQEVILLLSIVATGACASRGAEPRFPGSTVPPTRHGSLPASPTGRAVAESALTYRGVPYRSGGASPSGFDCSGLVQYVFSQYGVRLPKTVREQAVLGRKVSADSITAGDLVFFRTTGRKVSHVGVAISKTSFVHAPNSRSTVRVERFGDGYWASRFVAARRLDSLLRAAR